MLCGTEEKPLWFAAGIVEGTRVLDVGNAFDGHAALAEHGEIGLA